MAAEQSSESRAKKYAKSDDITIEQAKRRIAEVLASIESRDDAISSSDLGELVGLRATTVRDLIPEIRTEYNLPIVACSKGYYPISSVSQLKRELERIEEEIETRKQRRQDLCQAFNQQREGR